MLLSELPQVLPQYVESDTQDRKDYDLPEEVLEEDQGAHDRQRDVDTDYEPGESPPETGLDEGEHGDGQDERGEQVLSLIGEDADERQEHQTDADRSPELRHPTGAGLSLGDGARSVRNMRADGGTPSTSPESSLMCFVSVS